MTKSLKLYITLTETARRGAELDERYTAPNQQFLAYMKAEEFDYYEHWHAVAQWLDDNDHLDEVNEATGREFADGDELAEEDPEDIWPKLPEWLRDECQEDVLENLMQNSPVEAPTYKHMDLHSPKPLPRGTWLVHFSDHADEIARQGFKRGVFDYTKLGLTTYMNNDGHYKKTGGYNFAFLANGKDARWAASQKKYGRDCVLFQNSGVHAYHYGDEEQQIVFWGEDVDPRDIILIQRGEEHDFEVKAKRDTRRENNADVLFGGTFEACVNWSIKNFAQYRRYLTGR